MSIFKCEHLELVKSGSGAMLLCGFEGRMCWCKFDQEYGQLCPDCPKEVGK